MTHISLISHATDLSVGSRKKPSKQYLSALSTLLIIAGSVLITLAALINWWPVSAAVLSIGAVLFWTLVAVTARDERRAA